MPPQFNYQFVQCGPNIEPLIPTTYIAFVGGQLKQWFEASCTADGVTYHKGEWHPVPSWD